MDEKGKGGEGRESKEAWGEEERTPPPRNPVSSFERERFIEAFLTCLVRASSIKF